MAACFTRSAVCPAPSLRRHSVLRQRRPARESICYSLGFSKKKAEPSTPLAWAKDVGPVFAIVGTVFAIVGTVASLVVAWNTVVVQPNKAQLQELRTELQELRTDQQKQLQELTTRLEQLLGPLKPLPERLARTEGQVDVVEKVCKEGQVDVVLDSAASA